MVKETEVEAPVEEEAPVEVSESLACPFCDGEMIQEPAREGAVILVFRCEDCGFEAKFVKDA